MDKKQIPGFRYYAYSDGSIESPYNRLLRPIRRKYLDVLLWVGPKKYQWFKVHRLIAITFIPNPQNKPEVNHKNGDKYDNRVENLEWVTRSENQKHAFANGLNSNTGTKNGRAILTPIQIQVIREAYHYFTLKQIAKYFNVALSTIHKVVTNKSWSHARSI